MSHDDAAPATRPGTIQVAGGSLPLARVLGAEAKPTGTLARNAFFLLTGLLFPIAAMVAFTVLSGPAMWAVGLLLALGPFVAAGAGLVWPRPWGVIVETPEQYRCIHTVRSQDEAERIAAEIRAAVA